MGNIVLIENDLVKRMCIAILKLDQNATRPVIVSLCPDSLYHGAESGISRCSMELGQLLSQKGIMTTTNAAMWRSMHVVFGSPYPILRKAKRTDVHKNTIWAVIEKHLFRQRVLLLAAADRENVRPMNDASYIEEKSGITAEVFRDVTRLPDEIKVVKSRIDVEEQSQKHHDDLGASGRSDDQEVGAKTTRFSRRTEKAKWVEVQKATNELVPDTDDEQ